MLARLRVSLLLWLALAIAMPNRTVAQKPDGDTAELDHLAAEVEGVLRKTHTPGAAIAVVRRGAPLWVRGFGVADVASARPVTPDTLFRAGSVSKMFAALAVLKLQAEHRLDLQDTLRTRAPDLEFTNPWESEHPVRLVHLLEHTAGWDDWAVAEYGRQLPADGTLRDGLAFHPATRTSRWPPGTQYSYSNADPAAIAHVVERATGMTFEAYVGEAWFAPLQMTTASYLGTPDVLRRLATSYQADGKTPFPYWYQLERPAGALNASVAELAHLVQFLLDRGSYGGAQLLPAAVIERMETPASSFGARAGLATGYGLANYTTIQDGHVYHGHDGSLQGYLTELKYLPDAGVGYVLAINSRNPGATAEIGRLLRHHLEKVLVPPIRPASATVPPAVASAFAGWYEDDGPRVEFAHWWWRLFSLSHAGVSATQLTWRPLLRPRETYVATSERLYRRESDPVPTVALVNEDASGPYVQFSSRGDGGANGQTYRRISFGLVVLELLVAAATPCAIAATLLIAVIGLIARRIRPARDRVFPWVMVAPAMASLLAAAAIAAICKQAIGDLNQAVVTAAPAKPLFLAVTSVLFALAITGIAVAVPARRNDGRNALRWYALGTSCVLAASSGYLVYWGLAGLKTF